MQRERKGIGIVEGRVGYRRGKGKWSRRNITG